MNSALQQAAHREMTAWQAAYAALADYATAYREACRLIAEATAQMRGEREAQVAVLDHRPRGVVVAAPERWGVVVAAAHRHVERAARDREGVPELEAAFEQALTVYDAALRDLIKTKASDFDELAHQMSRLAASEQEASPTALLADGVLPARPGTFRAALRASGGFEEVMRHLRAQLIDLAGLQPVRAACA